MSKNSITRRLVLILLLISVVMVSTTACASRQAEKTPKVEEPQAPVNSDSDISANIEEKDTNLLDENNTQSEDEPEKSELTMHTEIKTFAEVDGKTLTMSIDIPQNWTFRTDDPNAIDQYIDDENGMKVAGSFGIVQFLKKDESLEELQNAAGFLTPIQSSSLITLDQRKYLLETSIIGDSNKEIIMAYNYSFVENGAVINFYFYNAGDKKENIEIYEEVLKSIKVTIDPIDPREKTDSENDYSQYNYLVEPIIHSNILSYTFSCKDNPPPFGSVMWYYLWQAFGGSWEYREYQIPNYIAQENVESVLMKHFELTPEQIRSNTTAYSEKEKGYRDPEGVGGGGLTFKITQVQENQDLLILTIEIFNADGFKQGISILTIKTEGDNWIYLSNEASSV